MRTPSFMPYAAGLAATLILSGCAAEEVSLAVPTSVTTPSSRTAEAPSTTPATTVDPVVARIPQAARADTQEGAEAFAKFFYEQVAKSWMKADPALLDGLYTEDCKTCAAFMETTEYLSSNDQRFVGSPAPLVIKNVEAVTATSEQAIIAVHVNENPGSILDSSGATVRRVDGTGRQTFVATLRWAHARWTVVRSQVEKRS